MSSFKFTDLSDEIQVLVSKELVRENAAPHYQYREDMYEKIERELKLKELAIMNSLFTRPAQAQLFYKIDLYGKKKTSRFMECIKSNCSLSLMVKEIDLKAYSSENWDLDSARSLDEVIELCSGLNRLAIGGQRNLLDFLPISKAKGQSSPLFHDIVLY